MLSRIEVQNFLSYRHAVVELQKNDIVALIGENGHGKSALLESVRFALFGDGRDNLSGLRRIRADGPMKVIVDLQDVPYRGKNLRVERGQKGSSGFCNVYVDGNLEASGGASPGGSSTQAYIDGLLGMNRETFGLTAFFGLGANDQLMMVTSAERLETLQRIANITICATIHKKANKKASDADRKAELAAAALETLEQEFDESVEELTKQREQVVKRYNQTRAKVEELSNQRNVKAKKESGLRKVATDKASVAQDHGKAETSLENLKQAFDETEEAIKGASASVEMLTNDLAEEEPKAEGLEELDERSTEIAREHGATRNAIKLREIGLREKQTECPLCGCAITDETIESWRTQIDELTAVLKELENESKEISAQRLGIEKAKKKIDLIRFNLSTSQETLEQKQKLIPKLETDIKVADERREKLEQKLTELDSKLAGFDKLTDALTKLTEQIEARRETMGELNTEADNLKAAITATKNAEAKVKEYRDEITKLTLVRDASRLVAEAYNRYAIPVELLRNLRTSIEDRSTRIYQEFDNGAIVIEDIDGGRPGVEFVLVDRMGKRPFKVLSGGERVMMFLAVRVAITQIVKNSLNSKIDFLMLDEIAEKLSPARIDDLVRVVNKMLKKYFPQVLLISHVPIRDIFTRTLQVKKEHDISEIEEL